MIKEIFRSVAAVGAVFFSMHALAAGVRYISIPKDPEAAAQQMRVSVQSSYPALIADGIETAREYSGSPENAPRVLSSIRQAAWLMQVFNSVGTARCTWESMGSSDLEMRILWTGNGGDQNQFPSVIPDEKSPFLLEKPEMRR